MPKILTQCNTADLKWVVELARAEKKGDPTPKLNHRQAMALIAVTALRHAGLTLEEIYTIRELLFWEGGHWTYKFLRTTEAMEVKKKLSQPETQKLMQEKLAQIGNKLES